LLDVLSVTEFLVLFLPCSGNIQFNVENSESGLIMFYCIVCTIQDR